MTPTPKGFKFAAVEAAVKKPGRLDFALIWSETPAAAAAVFTTNKVVAAPVIAPLMLLLANEALRVFGRCPVDPLDFIGVMRMVPREERLLFMRLLRDVVAHYTRIPVLGAVHRGADMEIAIPLVVNAKMRRTGICGAMETLLLDAQFLSRRDKPLLIAGPPPPPEMMSHADRPKISPTERSPSLPAFISFLPVVQQPSPILQNARE